MFPSFEQTVIFYGICAVMMLALVAFDMFRYPVCRACENNARTKRSLLTRRAICSVHGELGKKGHPLAPIQVYSIIQNSSDNQKL